MSRPAGPRGRVPRLLLPLGLVALLAGAGAVAWAGGLDAGWLAGAVGLGLGGAVIGLLALVGRRQRRIAALEERVRELDALSCRRALALGAAGIGTWEYDPARDVLTGDGRMREIFGFGPGEAGHHPDEWRARLHPEDAAEAEPALRAAVACGERYRSRFRLLLPGGEIRHVRASGARIVDSDGSARIVGVCREMTEDAVREKALRAKAGAAEAARAAESRHFAAMSHEARLPLSGVIEMLDLLREGEPGPDQRRRVEVARAWAAVLREILDGIGDGESGAERMPVAPAPTQVGRLVEEVAARYRPIAGAKGVPVAVEIAPRVPAWLICDPVHLRRIVVILLGNAIRFTESGRIAVKVAYVSRTAHLAITVEDTGIGINPEDGRRLFQSPLPAEGAGGGLAIAERLAGLMGGSISVESAGAGRGSIFVATLSAPRGSTPDDADPDARTVQRPLSVLLVEDNRTNQMVVSAMLQRAGHRVVTAANGAEALDAVRCGQFDVVLMDVEMPVMDGRAAVRAIRAMEGPAARLPVVALTAHAMPGDRERYIGLGMNDYLAKPIAPKALAAALERATIAPA